MELTEVWLRHHIFSYGLFGQRQQSDRDTFLNVEQTKALAVDRSRALRSVHLQHQLIPCRWDLMPVYTMIDTSNWDDQCRMTVLADIASDDGIDGFTLMVYGSNYSTDKATIDKICGYEPFHERVKQRLTSPNIAEAHESVKLALEKALDP